uniref:Uncharacterized protein n=1 Tax=Meloidogyne hapla TaxID=6305 RepID=A0A1I8BBP3_MELHA
MKQLFASTPVKNYLILLFCLFQYMFIQHVEGEQKQFRVQVLPANNVWNVWVSNSGNEQYKSQEWILYPAENGSIFTNEEKEMYEVNVFDFDKIHLFHFGEYNVTEDNELSINIQLQNAKILENLAREKYYAVVITEPEGILSSIGSILFEKGLETTNDQLNSQIFHLNLIGNEAKSSIISKVMSLVPSPKTIKSTFNKSKSFDKPESSKSKPSFTRSLSNLLPTPAKITSAISKSNRLLSKSPSINLSKPPSKKESPSKNKRSKIEKFLASNTTPVLKVCIEKGSYGCFQCVKEMEDDNGRAMKKELINQPKCCRKIANPILQVVNFTIIQRIMFN